MSKTPFTITIHHSVENEPRVIVEGKIDTKKVTDTLLKPFVLNKSWFLRKAREKAPGRNITSILYDGSTFTKNKWEPLGMKMEAEVVAIYKKPVVSKLVGVSSLHNVAKVNQKYPFVVDSNHLSENVANELDEDDLESTLQQIHNGPEDTLKVIWNGKIPPINDKINIHAGPINRSGLTITTTVGEPKQAENLYRASSLAEAVLLPNQTLECTLAAENSVVVIDVVFRVTLTGGVAYVHAVNNALYYPINSSFWGCNYIQNYYGSIESSFHVKNTTTFATGKIGDFEGAEATVDVDDMKKIE